MCWLLTSSLPLLGKSIAKRILASVRDSGLGYGSWLKWLRELVLCQVLFGRYILHPNDALLFLKLTGKDFYAADVRRTPWGIQNCYWDEKTIDIQWNRNQSKSKKVEYRTGKFRKY